MSRGATKGTGADMAPPAARRGSIPRPTMQEDLQDYEGLMVGMKVSERPAGLSQALTEDRASGRLATEMLGMQSEFMDELGLREQSARRKPPTTQTHVRELREPTTDPVWRKSLGSKWSKLALASLALCGMLAISVLVLQIEGSKLFGREANHLAERDAMVDRTNKLQDSIVGQDSANKCSKYEEMFLQWLTVFCKVANCTSELCHKSWVPFEGHCYYFSKDLLDWEKSRKECIDQGSELLVVRNKKEQKFVGGHDPLSVFWIGLRETPHLMSWRWLDGSSLLDDVTFWEKDYPDSYFDYELEDFKYCGGLRSGAWINAACNSAQRHVCKRKTEKLPVDL